MYTYGKHIIFQRHDELKVRAWPSPSALLWSEASRGKLMRRWSETGVRKDTNVHLLYGDVEEMLKLKFLGNRFRPVPPRVTLLTISTLLWRYQYDHSCSQPLEYPEKCPLSPRASHLPQFPLLPFVLLLPVDPFLSPHPPQLLWSLRGALCFPKGLLKPYLPHCFSIFLLSGPTTVCITIMAPDSICLVSKLPLLCLFPHYTPLFPGLSDIPLTLIRNYCYCWILPVSNI